ncbi:MAG: hypothetical protein Q4E06_07400, partial [Lautropia sp.]|nr:hypothetical protein [Lautropia sp.]
MTGSGRKGGGRLPAGAGGLLPVVLPVLVTVLALSVLAGGWGAVGEVVGLAVPVAGALLPGAVPVPVAGLVL